MAAADTAASLDTPTAARGIGRLRAAAIRQRILSTIDAQLQPGEELQEWVVAQVRPRLLLGLEALFGPLMMLSVRMYYLAATNQRFFALRVSRRSAKRLTVEVAEAFDDLRVERLKSGPLWTQARVRRPTDGTLFRFRIIRTERKRAEQVLGVLTPS